MRDRVWGLARNWTIFYHTSGVAGNWTIIFDRTLGPAGNRTIICRCLTSVLAGNLIYSMRFLLLYFFHSLFLYLLFASLLNPLSLSLFVWVLHGCSFCFLFFLIFPFVLGGLNLLTLTSSTHSTPPPCKKCKLSHPFLFFARPKHLSCFAPGKWFCVVLIQSIHHVPCVNKRNFN